MIKKNQIFLGLVGASVMFASCSQPAESKKETESLPPVETNEPNKQYASAFEGQTRIAGVKSSFDVKSAILSEALNKPWGITTLPDGRFLITQKEGTMKIATVDGSLSDDITGLPKVASEGQGGLLGVRVAPDFETSRMVYFVFAEPVKGGNHTSVGKGRLSDDEKKIENVSVIYRATPAYDGKLHFGGRILFDKEGNLFVSTGERSDLETRPQAQDLNSGLGKVIHITTDGKPVPGNPFEGQAGARPELYSYGHRNVQSLSIHPETGGLWGAEFGPRGGDEVNLIEPGKNYGWPVITYGIEYKGDTIGTGIQQKEGMEQPVYYWDPSISPSGMTFYSGDAIPEWKNNLFIGTLSSTHIIRLVIENNKVVGEERLLEAEKQRFRDVTQGADGALYAVTDGGRLYRIGK